MQTVSRRTLLQGAAAATAVMASGIAVAGKDHKHSHHKNPHGKLVDTALDCVKTGDLCLDHCMHLFTTGDTSLAECAEAVNELVIICTALAKMASHNSNHLPAVAKAAMAVCEECEAECLKHKEHEECKVCADACAACRKECKKLV